MKSIIMALSILALTGCCDRVKEDEQGLTIANGAASLPDKQDNATNDLQVLLAQDPVMLAQKAREKGDMRAMGLSMRSGIVTPGLEDYDGELLDVPGTSDQLTGLDHLEMLKKFKEFARQYNQALFSVDD